MAFSRCYKHVIYIKYGLHSKNILSFYFSGLVAAHPPNLNDFRGVIVWIELLDAAKVLF